MCLVHEFGRRVSAKSVLRVMRRMGLRCRIRAANPWRRYSSYRGETGGHVHNLLKRDFDAERPFSKLGTDVTEFKVAGGKAYLAPVYDMASKEIVAWDVSRHPDMDQQKRLLAMLAERLPAGVFCQVGVGRFGVSFSPCERRVSGRFGVGRSCWLLVIALVIA